MSVEMSIADSQENSINLDQGNHQEQIVWAMTACSILDKLDVRGLQPEKQEEVLNHEATV